MCNTPSLIPTASALHQCSVILTPVAKAILGLGFLVFHTSRLPTSHLRDYFCNNAKVICDILHQLRQIYAPTFTVADLLGRPAHSFDE
jgi:hypothetical protein